MQEVSYMNPINFVLSIEELDLLFQIVCHISENLWKNLTLHPITTSYEYFMYISINEGLVKHQKPDLLHEVDLEKS
jgi:hypothetical protein